MPFYVLMACIVTFLLYYFATATGFVPIAHLFFILSTICLGLFVTLIVGLKEGVVIKKRDMFIVSVVMSLFGLFLLYWRHIWNFFGQTLQRRLTRQQKDEIY